MMNKVWILVSALLTGPLFQLLVLLQCEMLDTELSDFARGVSVLVGTFISVVAFTFAAVNALDREER